MAGTIEERRRGLLGDKSVFHPLKPENRFRTGMMGGRIVLFAIAERDTQVMFLTGHTDQRDVMRWLAIGFAALFGAPMLIGLALSLIGAE